MLALMRRVVLTTTVLVSILAASNTATAFECPEYVPPTHANITIRFPLLEAIGSEIFSQLPPFLQNLYNNITANRTNDAPRFAFEWAVSPTDRRFNDPPLNSRMCPHGGYVSQYKDGYCVGAADTAPRKQFLFGDSCYYNFAGRGAGVEDSAVDAWWSFFADEGTNLSYVLTLSCDNETLHSDPDALPDEVLMRDTATIGIASSRSYTVYLSGNYKGVCGDEFLNGRKRCTAVCAFFIIFFSSAAVYVLALIAANYWKGGKRGKEIAFCGEYWAAVGTSISDAVTGIF